MTSKEIAALPIGRELDLAVHKIVFRSETGKNVPKYSTTKAGMAVITEAKLPLSVGRSLKGADAWYDESKPYFALDRTPLTKGQKQLVTIAATPEVALVKLACIYMIETGKWKAAVGASS